MKWQTVTGIIGAVVSVLAIMSVLVSVGAQIGTMQAQLDDAREELSLMRDEVRGLENYIRDYFASR